jgi:hypothetical protein
MKAAPEYKIRISMVIENYKLKKYIESLQKQLKGARDRNRELLQQLKRVTKS